MTILVDTNILVRWAHRGAASRPQAIAAIRALRGRGEDLVASPQNWVEFWHVATRPVNVNGLGLDPVRVDQVAQRLERFFRLLPDDPSIHAEWRQLVVTFAARGRQVFDARLAAVMKAHGIDHILTFNTADFARYPGLVAVHPRDAASAP